MRRAVVAVLQLQIRLQNQSGTKDNWSLQTEIEAGLKIASRLGATSYIGPVLGGGEEVLIPVSGAETGDEMRQKVGFDSGRNSLPVINGRPGRDETGGYSPDNAAVKIREIALGVHHAHPRFGAELA